MLCKQATYSRLQNCISSCMRADQQNMWGGAARAHILTLHTMSPAAWSSTKSTPLQSGHLRSWRSWAPSTPCTSMVTG